MFKEINRKFDEQELKDISDESVKEVLEILEKYTGIVLKDISRNGLKEFNRYIVYDNSLYNNLLPSISHFQPFPQDRLLNANLRKLACFFVTNTFEDGLWRFVKYHSKNKLIEYVIVGYSEEMYAFRIDKEPSESIQMLVSTEDLRRCFENIRNA